MKKTKQKTFDCVKMKRKSASIIYNKIKNMSMNEELAFWAKEDEKAKLFLKSIKKKTA